MGNFVSAVSRRVFSLSSHLTGHTLYDTSIIYISLKKVVDLVLTREIVFDLK